MYILIFLSFLLFQPSKETYSFCKQVLHLISWVQIMFSRLLDEVPVEDEFREDEVKNKSELQNLLVMITNETQVKIQQMKKSEWKKTIPIDGNMIPFKDVFLDLIEHEAHHRGQLAVYYRLSGLQPPSYLEEEFDINKTHLLIDHMLRCLYQV
ncbi:DinB family protein [Salipaludibacillus agaradhaerens]|uniref:DinB family protein n=1 Tax=Salipaludibacillus agaradhaerens TaxID=76935 RepID=UPI00216D93BD|nr:DinB family protein [Salipaludibacillus agaradhaerens]MCR6119027.1 DinB family protein [Salipaludibacillus agaradhaerens]UJW59758.1 DinB family protein [Bacillus sp. A116_S68]